MNDQERASSDMTFAEPHHERVDDQMRDIVNHAISVQESSNTMSALEYLKANGVDPRVIERVLLEPHRRRTAVPG